MKPELPKMETVLFPGTIARFNSVDFKAGMLFVEYTMTFEREINARIFFNTSENCRVFMNGDYVFGRECGRVAPSSHRIPINQMVHAVLPPGRHTLVAVIDRPPVEKQIEWIVGVADRDDNDQWVPSAFCLDQP